MHADEEYNREFLITKSAIKEGYESDVSPRISTLDEIMKAAILRRTAKNEVK